VLEPLSSTITADFSLPDERRTAVVVDVVGDVEVVVVATSSTAAVVVLAGTVVVVLLLTRGPRGVAGVAPGRLPFAPPPAASEPPPPTGPPDGDGPPQGVGAVVGVGAAPPGLTKEIGVNTSLVCDALPCAPMVSTPHCTVLQSIVDEAPVALSCHWKMAPRTVSVVCQLPEQSMW
jgi:hypothetical protein